MFKIEFIKNRYKYIFFVMIICLGICFIVKDNFYWLKCFVYGWNFACSFLGLVTTIFFLISNRLKNKADLEKCEEIEKKMMRILSIIFLCIFVGVTFFVYPVIVINSGTKKEIREVFNIIEPKILIRFDSNSPHLRIKDPNRDRIDVYISHENIHKLWKIRDEKRSAFKKYMNIDESDKVVLNCEEDKEKYPDKDYLCDKKDKGIMWGYHLYPQYELRNEVNPIYSIIYDMFTAK